MIPSPSGLPESRRSPGRQASEGAAGPAGSAASLSSSSRSPARSKPQPDDPAERLCRIAILASADAHALPVGELAAPSRRSARAALARQSAMYLAHVAFGLPFAAIGRAFGRDRTTVAHACRVIEDRRDDPATDAAIARLEQACLSLARGSAAPVQA